MWIFTKLTKIRIINPMKLGLVTWMLFSNKALTLFLLQHSGHVGQCVKQVIT